VRRRAPCRQGEGDRAVPGPPPRGSAHRTQRARDTPRQVGRGGLMAKYQVMFWKHIPAHVKAWDEQGEVKRLLPDRFQAAIDAFAMKDGSTEMDAYLDGWHWSDTQDRPGSADDVASTVVSELDAANPRSVLMSPTPEKT